MLTIFTLSIMIGVTLAAKRCRGTLLVLSVFFAAILAFCEPLSFGFAGQPPSTAFRWGSYVVWAGMFLLTSSLIITFYERQSVAKPRAHPTVMPPAALPYDLILATMTHLSRVEKFVKRFQPIPKRDGGGDPFQASHNHPVSLP